MFDEPMSLDRKVLEISQGLAKTFSRRIFNDQGYPILGFTGREKIEAVVWSGDTGTPVRWESPVATWTKPAEGEYQIAVPAMSIHKGVYSITAILDPNGEVCYESPREIYRGYIRVNASPSDSLCDPLKSYCTYQDLLDRAPWIETTFTDNDLSGFARQRHKARQWIDEAIQRNAPNTSWNASNVVFYGLFPPGFSTRSRVASLLKNDMLIVSPEIREAAARYSLWLICDALSSSPTSGSYAEIAAKQYLRANTILQSLVANFSEDGESVVFSVDMRKVQTRSMI